MYKFSKNDNKSKLLQILYKLLTSLNLWLEINFDLILNHLTQIKRS